MRYTAPFGERRSSVVDPRDGAEPPTSTIDIEVISAETDGAGAREHVAFRVRRERPDVLVVTAEERRRLAVSVDLVNPPVGRRAHVQPAVRRERQRVRFELGAVEEHRSFALRIDPEDLALVA